MMRIVEQILSCKTMEEIANLLKLNDTKGFDLFQKELRTSLQSKTLSEETKLNLYSQLVLAAEYYTQLCRFYYQYRDQFHQYSPFYQQAEQLAKSTKAPLANIEIIKNILSTEMIMFARRKAKGREKTPSQEIRESQTALHAEIKSYFTKKLNQHRNIKDGFPSFHDVPCNKTWTCYREEKERLKEEERRQLRQKRIQEELENKAKQRFIALEQRLDHVLNQTLHISQVEKRNTKRINEYVVELKNDIEELKGMNEPFQFKLAIFEKKVLGHFSKIRKEEGIHERSINLLTDKLEKFILSDPRGLNYAKYFNVENKEKSQFTCAYFQLKMMFARSKSNSKTDRKVIEKLLNALEEIHQRNYPNDQNEKEKVEDFKEIMANTISDLAAQHQSKPSLYRLFKPTHLADSLTKFMKTEFGMSKGDLKAHQFVDFDDDDEFEDALDEVDDENDPNDPNENDLDTDDSAKFQSFRKMLVK